MPVMETTLLSVIRTVILTHALFDEAFGIEAMAEAFQIMAGKPGVEKTLENS